MQRKYERRCADATEGLWMLKVAIVIATAAVLTSLVNEILVTIGLFAVAAGAVAGFWWKFAVPFAQLTLSLKTLPKELEEAKRDRADQSETLAETHNKLTDIAVQVNTIEEKLDHVEKQMSHVERQASTAIDIAEVVQKTLERGR